MDDIILVATSVDSGDHTNGTLPSSRPVALTHCHIDSKPTGVDKRARKKLILASCLCLIFMTGECVGGVMAHSLAVVSDAAHMLTDFASFMISLLALYLASRPATKRLSFGWYRAEILGALVSILMLWVITGILCYSAVLRVESGNYEIDADIMLITSSAGVVVNIILGCTLHQHGHSHGPGHNHSHSSDNHHHHQQQRSHTTSPASHDTHQQHWSHHSSPASDNNYHPHQHPRSNYTTFNRSDNILEHQHVSPNYTSPVSRSRDNQEHPPSHYTSPGSCDGNLHYQQLPSPSHNISLGSQNSSDIQHQQNSSIRSPLASQTDDRQQQQQNSSLFSPVACQNNHQHQNPCVCTPLANQNEQQQNPSLRNPLARQNDDRPTPLANPNNHQQYQQHSAPSINTPLSSQRRQLSTGRASDYGSISATSDKALLLEKEERRKKGKTKDGNINVKAAFIHVVGDFCQSLGVLAAAIIIYFKPEWKIADPICTFLFSFLVLITTINILRDILMVLMEGTPRNINFEDVRDTILNLEGVKDLHDLRVWSLTMDKTALSVHLAIERGVDAMDVVQRASQAIQHKYNIHQSTMQVEEYAQDMDDCTQCQHLKD